MIGLAPRPNGRTPEGGFEYRRPWAVILGALIGAGIAGVVIYALHTSWTGTSSALAVGLLLSGASLVIGGLTGFLFGTMETEPPIRAWMEINHVTRETVAGQGRST